MCGQLNLVCFDKVEQRLIYPVKSSGDALFIYPYIHLNSDAS